jgi:hypothetical protein
VSARPPPLPSLVPLQSWSVLHRADGRARGRGCTPHYRGAGGARVAEEQLKVLRAGAGSAALEQFGPSAEELAAAVDVELAPGDLLYFPAGHWHRVECLEVTLFFCCGSRPFCALL